MLDHGILNVPLAKRGNIDAQIDAYKRELAREAAAHRRATFHSVREKKLRVAELLAAMSDERLLRLAAPLGKRKPSTARTALASAARTNLDRWIAALERESVA